MEMPVCNIFEPKNLNDQVCFETDLEKLKYNGIGNTNNLKIGLVLLLDYNDNRQMYFPNTKTSEFEEKEDIFTYNEDNPALIYFDTIS